jgi:hypothetical protein
MRTRQPQSKFEKFFAGLEKLLVLQPAATMTIRGTKFCIGDAEDPFISQGAKDFLKGLGFFVEAGSFCFKVHEEK